MAVSDYKTDPNENTTISGINIAEGCPPSGINNAIRQLMADVKADKTAQDTATAACLPLTGGTMTGNLYDKNASMAFLPVGAVFAFAANSAPAGCLICNGAEVSRTTYAELFDAIGTTYGEGDGSTTFNLPNLTDKFIQGSGTAGTVHTAGLPQIWAYGRTIGFRDWKENDFSGALTIDYKSNIKTEDINGSTYCVVGYTFEAKKYNAIYGASSTVQPPAVTMRYYIKY